MSGVGGLCDQFDIFNESALLILATTRILITCYRGTQLMTLWLL